MGKSLVIVESPAKAKTINKFLGSKFVVKASVGHVRDLPKKNLGIDIENSFKPQYIPVPGKSKVFKALRDAAKNSDAIYLAPDPDREGEAIAWHIAHILKKEPEKLHRVMFNAITSKAVVEAIENPTAINMNLVNAQQARRVLDRLVGYQVSPILWKAIHYGKLSAGRVQSVALRLICEREEEVEAFKPTEYWTVTAIFTTKNGEVFSAKLAKIEKKKAEIPNQDAADKILSDLKSAQFHVSKVERAARRKNPLPPFITSTLQQDSANRFRFGAKRTMAIAQQLYEGMEVGQEGASGLITYMRTDSTRIAPEAQMEAREFIMSRYGSEYVPKKARIFKTKKKAQDAHEAIRPTSVSRTPESIKSHLNRDQYRMYDLIWRRFVASQMSAAIFDATTIDIQSNGYIFRATGSILKFSGFLSVYEEAPEAQTTEEKKDPGKSKDTILPLLKEKERVDCKNLTPKQHFTKPPPRFTQASLVKLLETEGIGRPSTYASIVSTLVDREYVLLESRRFVPTERGRIVKKLLVQQFSNLFNVDFTAKMEADLDRIEAGDTDWVEMIRKFYVPFRSQLDRVEKQTTVIKQALQEQTNEKCPNCDSNLVIKWGRHGRFLSCSNFPTCKYARPIVKEGEKLPAETSIKCGKCGLPMIVKTGRFGRFLACSGYPDCKSTQPIPTGVTCPEPDCKGNLVEHKSKKGKMFYSCNKYPDCRFITNNRPIPYACPHCKHYYTEERKMKEGEKRISCPSCRKTVELPANFQEAI
ncbi:MAG: DNA topoisomerase I [Candidatus Cloacimonetes bacterium 4572_55]|nr:MAG: DNA topoisomerase I [Candidatus Cloacimonetes bacterium 4572_55]